MMSDQEIMRILEANSASPHWFHQTNGWAEEYHKTLTEAPGYTDAEKKILQITSVRDLDIKASATAIYMPANIPAFLSGMLAVIDCAILRSNDPHAPLKVSFEGLQKAAGRLSQIIEGLRETNMPLFPVAKNIWTPAVVAASHFAYLHEFYHIKLQHNTHSITAEEKWQNEFAADEYAWASYALSLRSHPELGAGLIFLAPVLVLYFGEIVELASGLASDEARASHPHARSRTFAIREKVRLAMKGGLVETDPLPMGDFCCRVLDALLLTVDTPDFPRISPVEQALRTLLADIKGQNIDRLQASRNHMLQWYLLSDRNHLAESCKRALRVIANEQSELFNHLDTFKEYLMKEDIKFISKDDLINFLEGWCLFDKDRYEALSNF